MPFWNLVYQGAPYQTKCDTKFDSLLQEIMRMMNFTELNLPITYKELVGRDDHKVDQISTLTYGVVMFCPCLFCPSDNVWRSRQSDAPLFYCYHTFLDHTTNINRKVRAPRRVSALGAPNNVQNCHWDKTNMDQTSQNLIYMLIHIFVIFSMSWWVMDEQGL